MAAVTRIATTTALVLLASLGLTAYAGPSASASSKPPPTDPGQHATPQAKRAALPDHRRSPGLKAILSEKDADRGADDPAQSALCQKGVGKPNPYRNPFPNIDQIVRDATVPVGNMAGCSTAQNENTIAVNPENPRNLVSGTNDYRLFNSREQRNDGSGYAYTSFDGGRTWTDVQLPHLTFQTGGTGAFKQMDSAGDPVVAFGPHNTVYYGNIVFSRGTPAGDGTEAANGIALNVSHDGGLHWSEPLLIQADGVTPSGKLTPSTIFNDKIWLAADKHSGRVYVTWTRFADTPDGGYLESPIVLAASTDYGRSFGPRRRVDVTLGQFKPGGLTPYSSGSNPEVARDGTLYIAYEGEQCANLDCDQFGVTDRDVTVVARSQDHGRTFTKSIVDTNYDFPFNEPLGTETLTGENFRVNSFPQLAYDEPGNRLALTWNDDRNGKYDAKTGESLRSNGDNILSFSSDGRRWTKPQVLGTPQDEVFGAVGIHDGAVAVSSYTRHYAGARSVDLDYAFWSSSKRHGPGRFDLQRVTTQSSNPQIQFVGPDDEGNEVQGLFIGDYTGVALGSDGVLHPNWTDFRGKPGTTAPNQDAYTQAFRID
jgi:hypothetical protein